MNRAMRRAAKSLPVVFRFSAEDERQLQLLPHVMLDRFREGTASEPDWHTLAFRINVGLVLARQHFEDATRGMVAAQGALMQVQDRFDKHGKWGVAQPEFEAIAGALTLTDTMQKNCTRRELRDAFLQVEKGRID